MSEFIKGDSTNNVANTQILAKKTKFRFYITELFDGEIIGTNDPKIASDYAAADECFVVDTETNKWLISNGTDLEIKEAQ